MPVSATHRDVQIPGSATRRLLALVAGLLILAGSAPTAGVRAVDATGAAPDDGIRPTIQYEEAMAHAGDKTAFAPGGRVTVPFQPRKSDRWAVDGGLPKVLPVGRLSGKAMRDPAAEAAADMLPSAVPPTAAVSPVDAPYVEADPSISFHLAAAVDPGGLRREVFGFLPYWELTDGSTRLDWEKLSTIAYFGVGATSTGDLQKKNSDGSTTVGWSGWTSAKLTNVINAAHASGARVVLTVQSFAWSTAGANRQKALLGSRAHRVNLARQIAAAVRNRGADGVNLDFEPIVATYANEFTALVRSVRAELNKVSKGYQLTFDTTGWIGNYPVEAATAKGGADAVMVMGYDYRAGSSNPVGSVAPLARKGYDIADTIASYLRRVPASKVILGVPYYGRAWSTDSSALHAKNISGTQNGASTTVVYSIARQFAADHGRKWDPVEGVAWTSYRRQNCTAKYGCVDPWRQLYYDDAKALGLKYDLINRYNLRGAGIWALGYDGTRTELYKALKAKFITDKVPPKITGSSLSSPIMSPNGDGRMDTTTVRASVTGLLRFGWLVEPFADGIAGRKVRSGGMAGKNVVFQWDGKTNAGRVVPDGTYRITIWTADASDNRATVRKIVKVDRRPAGVALTSKPGFISPNGDGHYDRTTLSMRTDSRFTGSAGLLDKHGTPVRKWTFTKATAVSWVWNGKDTAGRTVSDGRYTLRVGGYDRAGNKTVRELSVRVDRTIRAVTWSRPSFVARARQTSRVSFALGRGATVTIAIYSGTRVVRRVWQDRAFAAGSHGWTWNGRTSAGLTLKPGTYKAVVTAKSSIGSSKLTRTVVVRAH